MQNKTSCRTGCFKSDSIITRKTLFYVFCVFLFSLVMMGCSGSVFHPYNTSFRCPPGYNGMCESLEEAYMDSIYEIDPRIYDSRWVKKRKKWEEKHKKLVNTRKALGYYETVEEKIKKYRQKVYRGSQQTSSYRKELFRELASLLKEPEVPFLVPPKVIRILVLSTLSPDENDKTIYVSPHYTYFILDEPKWLLHKIPERVPEGSANPLISR